MIKNYFKIAFRNLIKNKFSSFINIGGLAIGMAVAILIGLWIYDELSFNKNFKNYDRIAQVMQKYYHEWRNRHRYQRSLFLWVRNFAKVLEAILNMLPWLPGMKAISWHLVKRSLPKSGLFLNRRPLKCLSLKMLERHKRWFERSFFYSAFRIICQSLFWKCRSDG